MKLTSLALAGLTLSLACASVAEAAPAPAQATPQTQFLAERGESLVKFVNGQGAVGDVFAPAFLEKVPAERLQALAGKLRSSAGRAVGVASVEAASENMGIININFENRQLPFKVMLDPSSHLLVGLAISG